MRSDEALLPTVMNFFEGLAEEEEPFTQDDQQGGAPTDVDTHVIARIEEATLRLVVDLCAGKAPSLSLTSRAASNVSLQPANQASRQPQAASMRCSGRSSQQRATQDDDTQMDSQLDADREQQPGQVVIAVGQRTQTRTMLQNQGAGAVSIARSGYSL